MITAVHVADNKGNKVLCALEMEQTKGILMRNNIPSVTFSFAQESSACFDCLLKKVKEQNQIS